MTHTLWLILAVELYGTAIAYLLDAKERQARARRRAATRARLEADFQARLQGWSGPRAA